MAVEDGGPAFPGPFTGHCGEKDHAESCGCYVDQGMSLRDFFAASALMGLLASGPLGAMQDFSEVAYKHADNMLKKRAGA